jgi:YfiH family protein
LFTSRHGGVSKTPFDDWNLAAHVGDEATDVQSNRAHIAELAGVPADRVVFMRQCHSADVEVVDSGAVAEVQSVDGLVTSTPGLVVVALAADCVPVAMVDVEAGVVAAVHSGWQGMISDVVGTALVAMQDLGAARERIRVTLGPAICGPCYPVPPERAQQAAQAQPAAAATAPDGQPGIDVRAGLAARLRLAGVHTEFVGGCTAEDPQLFSYRRDGLTGRQGVAVWWTSA